MSGGVCADTPARLRLTRAQLQLPHRRAETLPAVLLKLCRASVAALRSAPLARSPCHASADCKTATCYCHQDSSCMLPSRVDSPYSVPPVSKACSGMRPSVVPGMALSTGRWRALAMAAASKLPPVRLQCDMRKRHHARQMAAGDVIVTIVSS